MSLFSSTVYFFIHMALWISRGILSDLLKGVLLFPEKMNRDIDLNTLYETVDLEI